METTTPLKHLNHLLQSLIDQFKIQSALGAEEAAAREAVAAAREEEEEEEPTLLAETDEEQLFETILELIAEIILSEPMRYIQPTFHEQVVDEVEELLEQQFTDVYANYEKENLEMLKNEISELTEKAMNFFYRHIAPKRSCGNTFIRIKPKIAQLKKKIDYLQAVPQPDQRTEAWHVFRHECLTASSIWKAFGSESSKNQLIYEKCKPMDLNKYKSVSTESAMHWGNKYEPLSILLYEEKYKTKVSDFGCIPHKHIPFVAASPDGINTCETSLRYGRMLEVKNIVNREINGIPKLEYWIQMQVQMEVCNLNECDFLETRFSEYESVDEFMADGPTFQESSEGLPKGLIMYFIKNGQPFYEYAPLNMTLEECQNWEMSKMEEHSALTWMKTLYWKLNEMSCVLVLRNELWFRAATPLLNNIWQTIQHEKVNGYDHRAPNKRMSSSSNKNLAATEAALPSKCLIDVSKYFPQE